MMTLAFALFLQAPAGSTAVPTTLPEPALVVGKPSGKTLSGAALEKRTEEVSSLLRCPVCQGSSVAASPSEMARNMKAQVKDLLAQGYDQEQVFQYFEASYGEFVRLEPKKEGIRWGVWLAPLLGLLLGLLLLVAMLRRLLSRAERAEPMDPLVEEYGPELLRIRALVTGEEVEHES